MIVKIRTQRSGRPQWYLYVLECRDGALYTGITLNVARRMDEHKKGKGSKYLRSNPPIKVVYQELLTEKSDALKREADIKSWPRKKKLDLIARKHQDLNIARRGVKK